MSKPVKVTRDGVTMTVADEKAAQQLVTAGWQPVKPAPTARKK